MITDNYYRDKGEKSGNDDVLLKLRPKISSAEPPKIPDFKYDTSALANVGKLTDDMLDKLQDEAADQADKKLGKRLEQEENERNSRSSGINAGDTSKDNLLAMIFKIVPIGINVMKKGKTLAKGLKQSALGVVNLVKGLAITSAALTVDSISYMFQLGGYLFKLMLCGISNAMNFHKCIVFYLIDIILFFLLMFIVSVLFIIDSVFFVKQITGVSCVELLFAVLDGATRFDHLVYEYISIHIFQYPPSVIEMCYTCSAMGDTSGYKEASSRMYKDVFKTLPKQVGTPVVDIVKGIGNIIGLFNI